MACPFLFQNDAMRSTLDEQIKQVASPPLGHTYSLPSDPVKWLDRIAIWAVAPKFRSASHPDFWGGVFGVKLAMNSVRFNKSERPKERFSTNPSAEPRIADPQVALLP